MDDNTLDTKIAPIAGLVEGRDFGEIPHSSNKAGYCRTCQRFSVHWKSQKYCYEEPPPRYHESLDLIVPVVRTLKATTKVRFLEAGLKRLNIEYSNPEGAAMALGQLLWQDNPAHLLAEALVEAVGGKE